MNSSLPFLDRLVRPTVRYWGRQLSSFQLWGYSGLAVAVVLAFGLIAARGLSGGVMLLIIASAISTFLALAMLSKILLGQEQLVYYHHEIAVMLSTTLLLWALDQPILPYLEITLLGIGAFLAFGRLGCLMVGCCHGKPYGWGVCYRQAHVAAGFTPYYAGVRLFPVQALESALVFLIVGVGSGLVLGGHPAGSALVWYVGAYGGVRFGLEFLRGDPRPYGWGFSQAQWISLLLMAGVSLAGLYRLLPQSLLHWGLPLLMATIMAGATGLRFLVPRLRYGLLNPNHVRELAGVLQLAARPGSGLAVRTTSLGIRLSASQLADGTPYHYALSHQSGQLTLQDARMLARLIGQLQPWAGSIQTLEGKQGVFHLLLRAQQPRLRLLEEVQRALAQPR